MSRKTLYSLCVIALLGFAASLLFIPDWFWNLYGSSLATNSRWAGRFLASVILVNVYLAWKLRDAPPENARAKLFSQAQVIEWGLVAIFIAIATLTGVFGAFAWGIVALSVLFTVFFAMDGFM
jgi:hypothetical protein